MRRRATGLLTAALVLAALAARGAAGDDEPVAEGAGPPPQEWLLPYGTEDVTSASFDTLRERLFRDGDEDAVARGLAWLTHARDPYVRQSVAQPLAGAYLLGEHLGTGFDEAVVPALRRLARDADFPTRQALLHELLRHHDSPLGREIALQHVRGEIPMPADASWDALRAFVRGYVGARGDPDDPDYLKKLIGGDDDELRRQWISAAKEHPATDGRNGWVTLDVRHGAPRDVELGARDAADPNFLVRVSFLGSEVVRSDRRRDRRQAERPTSIDRVSLSLRLPSSNGGGANTLGNGLYMAGISAFGDAWFDSVVRHLGDGRLRVWLRRRAPGTEPALPRR